MPHQWCPHTLHALACPSRRAQGMSCAGVTSPPLARSALSSLWLSRWRGGKGKAEVCLPSFLGKDALVQTRGGSGGVSCPHLRLTCTWQGCLHQGSSTWGRQGAHLTQKRAMLGLCTLGFSEACSPRSELTLH